MSNSSTQFTNHLAGQKSPYLLQHVNNPVDWFPWDEEAFAKARAEQKPIFLSIGYSTCHWCHVMAHESFENSEIAKILNDHFVSIKVDREERPDVDRLYMAFVQSTTGSGGWPMSVWLTPDLKPFFGGTYFPPNDGYGRPGFSNVLLRITELWNQNREKIVAQGDTVLAAMQNQEKTSATVSSKEKEQILQLALSHLRRAFDSAEGGFGNAPKFPRPVTLYFLFREYARLGSKNENGPYALEMALTTLRKMAAGGMHDHLGGGFHRYSVDAYWHIPHFEKMLYDQAQLACAYLEAYQITHELFFAETARDILDYVLRDMTDPSGGFYSAEDADSLLTPDKPEHAEGAFYVWTKAEIEKILGRENAEIFNFIYGVELEGNAPSESDPHGEFNGKNILLQRHSILEAANYFKKEEKELSEILDRSRAALLKVRTTRPRPHLDDKIITAWNGLMISAFARAYQILRDPAYLKAATKAAAFLKEKLFDENSKELKRNYRDGGASSISGFADDYAFLIQGLLDLYEADFEIEQLQWATQLQEKQDNLFWDNEAGGYYSTSGNDASVLLRLKEDYDGAEPSSNSVSALNLQRLLAILGNKEWKSKIDRAIEAVGVTLQKIPTALPQMLVAVQFSLQPQQQMVLAVTEREDPTLEKMLEEIHRHFLPQKITILADGNFKSQNFLVQYDSYYKEIKAIDEKPTAFICENFTCKLPLQEIPALKKLLDQMSSR